MFLAPCRPIYPDSPAGSAPPEKTQTTFKNRTSLYWASSLSSQHDATTTSICCWVQAYAGDIDQQLVCCAGARSYPSIYLRTVAQSTQQQTSRRPLLLSIDGTDRQKPDCYIDTAPHIMQAVIKMPLHWAYYYTHPFNGPLSGTTRVSRYQKGKNQSGFYWSKRQWVAVASAGPYASLHLAPDR